MSIPVNIYRYCCGRMQTEIQINLLSQKYAITIDFILKSILQAEAGQAVDGAASFSKHSHNAIVEAFVTRNKGLYCKLKGAKAPN